MRSSSTKCASTRTSTVSPFGDWAVVVAYPAWPKANTLAKANPDALVLLVAVELCSLTLIKNDYSKSNFIGSSLFSDGIAAVIVKGDNHKTQKNITIQAASSKLYYDSLEVMGWDFKDTGFKVLFSKDIPTFIHENIRGDIDASWPNKAWNWRTSKTSYSTPAARKCWMLTPMPCRLKAISCTTPAR
jgi:predicted naringenin-chalcone synthase